MYLNMPANRSTYAGSDDEKQRNDDSAEAPVEVRHEQIGDPTLADRILDRLVHNAHRIEMRGDSMRKVRADNPRQTDGSEISKRCATDRAESADTDIEMTRRKAFPAILRLREHSYRKPIE
jgi:hypothetical protein